MRSPDPIADVARLAAFQLDMTWSASAAHFHHLHFAVELLRMTTPAAGAPQAHAMAVGIDTPSVRCAVHQLLPAHVSRQFRDDLEHRCALLPPV